jgi:hypothetical protein
MKYRPLLCEIAAKVNPHAGGNPFDAAYLLVDDNYVHLAEVGTVDNAPNVDTSGGDGVVCRVAR